jgi:hypothetical protein
MRHERLITVEDRISRFAEMEIRRPVKRFYPQQHMHGPMRKEWLLILTCRLLRQAGGI